MSASRQKRTRQGDIPLTEKQRKQQSEAAAASRKKMIYTLLGIVMSVAIVALLVWDSGVIQRNAVAATIGETDYTVADVSYYYNQTKSNFLNQVEAMKQQYGFDMGYDTAKTPAEQTYSTDEATGEVTTYEDFFQESALENLQQVTALCAAAQADGYTLSEEGKTSLTEQSTQVDALATQYNTTRKSILKSLYGSYVTESLFAKHLEQSVLASDYLTHFQNGIDTSDAALDTYYQANKAELDSYSYRYASIKGSVETGTDADGKAIEATDEEKAAAKADAQTRADAMLAAIHGGAKFDAIAKDYVSELDKDTYTTENYTLRTDIIGSSLSTVYKDWLQDSGREQGDVELFEDTANNGYVLVEYVSQERNDTVTVNVRHALITPEGDTEDATEFTDDQWTAAEEKAKSILAQYVAGAKTPEAFGELAEEHSQDGRTAEGALNAAGGLYTNVNPGDMVAEFDAWIFDSARVAGDTGLVKTTYGWHVMYFQGTNQPNWKGSAESALVNETLESWMEEKTSAFEIVEAAGLAQVK